MCTLEKKLTNERVNKVDKTASGSAQLQLLGVTCQCTKSGGGSGDSYSPPPHPAGACHLHLHWQGSGQVPGRGVLLRWWLLVLSWCTSGLL
jgi:hypothetical protein